jgi:hypothetical protein
MPDQQAIFSFVVFGCGITLLSKTMNLTEAMGIDAGACACAPVFRCA